jgi:NAD+ synthase (glutamine-hydrolysing)
MSMYAVNADVPKTVIRQIISCYAESTANKELRDALMEVIGTPVSPELLPTDEKGEIGQKTEDIVGPYELIDFFLYYILSYGYQPQRIAFLAEQAFRGQYDRRTILKWLGSTYSRFFASQFKRNCSADGPAVFSLSLSPRGGLKMPSDACVKLWTKETEILQFMEDGD